LLGQIIAYVGYYARFKRDTTTGLLDIYPANSLETWQCEQQKFGPPTRDTCVTGPMPEIAALSMVLPRLLALPRPNSTDASTWNMLRELWSDLFAHLPPLPVGHAKKVQICGTQFCGDRGFCCIYEPSAGPVLLPGWRLPNITGNSENSELYAVHPYRVVGLYANRSLGEVTYRSRRFPGAKGSFAPFSHNKTDHLTRQARDDKRNDLKQDLVVHREFGLGSGCDGRSLAGSAWQRIRRNDR